MANQIQNLQTSSEEAPSTDTKSGAQRESISAFVITFNEEIHIQACLESLSFCDEIVVIDSFSSDKTVEIAESFGAKVIQREWPGYRAQKAFGLSQVENRWVLNIDADERVSPELRGRIFEVLEGRHLGTPENPVVGFALNRVVFHLGRWWRSGGWYPEYRLRFFLKEEVRWGGRDPHEKPITDGRVERLEGELLHYTYKDLDDQFKRLLNFATVAAEEAHLAGKRAGFFDIFFKPMLRMFKFFVIKKGFLEGTAALIVTGAEGMYTFMKYAKLWEIEFNKKNVRSE